MLGGLSIFVAFVAGVVSFLSPCVLPIVPGFLAYLAGGMGTPSPVRGRAQTSEFGNDTKDSAPAASNGASRARVFISSVFFVLGFSVVFAILGIVLNTILAGAAFTAQSWLARIGGLIVISFGLYLTGLIRVKFLERAHTVSVKWKVSSRELTSFLFGASFAAGWTPCVGAALGAILGLAASAPGTAFALLMSYALGLGLPFLIVGLFAAEAGAFINRFGSAARYVTVIFGVILILFGILVFTQKLSVLANFQLVTQLLHA